MQIIELPDDFLAKKEKLMKQNNYPADYESILGGLPIEEQLTHFKILYNETLYDLETWNNLSYSITVFGALAKNGIIYGIQALMPEYYGHSDQFVYVNQSYLIGEDYEVDGGGYYSYNQVYAELKFIP